MLKGIDEDGEAFDLPFGNVLGLHYESTKAIYFDYMINTIDPSIDDFKLEHAMYCDKVVDMIHDAFADHVEGILKDKEEEFYD